MENKEIGMRGISGLFLLLVALYNVHMGFQYEFASPLFQTYMLVSIITLSLFIFCMIPNSYFADLPIGEEQI